MSENKGFDYEFVAVRTGKTIAGYLLPWGPPNRFVLIVMAAKSPGQLFRLKVFVVSHFGLHSPAG